jgi:TonB family protein
MHWHILKYVLALVVNFALFIIIPALHELFGLLYMPRTASLTPRRQAVEIIQPKQEEKRTLRSRIRKVETASRRVAPDAMLMRFAPDLEIAGESGVQMAAQDLQAEIFEEGETDEDLVPLHVPAIPYPERARELNVQGELLLELVIGRDGRVESVEVLKSPHPSISAAARKAVQQWRFRPAKNKGIPVRVRARKEIEFRLD